jgi:hypothetical protein
MSLVSIFEFAFDALVAPPLSGARNAINRQLGEELAACLAELRDDAALRAVIITGAGGARWDDYPSP